MIAERVHVRHGPCPGCGGMTPARYARMVGRVKCSMVGCPFTMGHLGRHAPGSRVPTFNEAMVNLGTSYQRAFAVIEHSQTLMMQAWERLAQGGR